MQLAHKAQQAQRVLQAHKDQQAQRVLQAQQELMEQLVHKDQQTRWACWSCLLYTSPSPRD